MSGAGGGAVRGTRGAGDAASGEATPGRNGGAGRASLAEGPVCPTPAGDGGRVQLGHGSGGKMSAALLRERFLPHLGNEILLRLGDAAVVPLNGGWVAISTDTFVVTPLEFPGGDIGSLAVHGTLNDVAMAGADPLYLSAGFVLEEGLDMGLLERVAASMGAAARDAGVPLVTGDTKVVERGKADGLYVNTTGVGLLPSTFRPAPRRARPGDAVLVSGPLGRHGIAVMAVREGLEFEVEVESDSACLVPLVRALRDRIGEDVHVLRDPTRGGLASALNEIAAASGTAVELDGAALPVPDPVSAACEMLGLDPLYVANEGILAAVVAAGRADEALEVLRSHPLGRDARRVGAVAEAPEGLVTLRTGLGATRVVQMLPGDQLPRIC